MSHKVFLSLCLVTLFVLIPGCAKPPSAAIAATDVAFEALNSVHADLYAPAELEQAQAALAAARTEVEVQNAKFALTRKYADAEQLFGNASSLAESAASAAESGQRAAQNSAEEAIELTRSRIEESASLLGLIKACPKKAKGMTTDTALLEGQVEGFIETLPAVDSMMSGADFIGAGREATSLTEQIDAINGDLTSALEQLGCSKPTGETSV